MAKKLILGFMFLVVTACTTGSDEPKPSFKNELYAAASVVNGAHLYDQWFAPNKGPVTYQPLWDEKSNASLKSPAESWRCSTCHGFSYLGTSGVSSLSLEEARYNDAKSPSTIFNFLRNGKGNGDNKHAFFNPGGMNEAQLYALTKFIKEGIITSTRFFSNIGPYIDVTNRANGDSSGGGLYYNGTTGSNPNTNTCTQCHGVKGDRELPEGVRLGVIADTDPWRFIHKLRYGPAVYTDPNATPMPNAEQFFTNAFSPDVLNQQMVNVLTFAQSNLPATQNLGDAIKGGKLYDDWFTVKGIIPDAQNPYPVNTLWTELALPAMASNKDTWRCSNCHGWDYAGKLNDAGKLVVVSLLLAAQPAGNLLYRSEEHLFTVISKGFMRKNSLSGALIQVHNFGNNTPPLGDQEIYDLVAFVKEAVVDVQGFFSSDPNSLLIHGGNRDNGKKLFQASGANCVSCHGVDGKSGTINVNIYDLSILDLKRAYHRIRVGIPGKEMPTTLEKNISPTDNRDIVSFILDCLQPTPLAGCLDPVLP